MLIVSESLSFPPRLRRFTSLWVEYGLEYSVGTLDPAEIGGGGSGPRGTAEPDLNVSGEPA